MAQGVLKKKPSATNKVKPAVAKRNNKKTSTKAAKQLKPKKQLALKQADLTKKHTAALTAATEKLVSSKVGHLELLSGDRREVQDAKPAKK